MTARKSPKPQPSSTASTATKPTVIAHKPLKKSPQPSPESVQEVVELPAPVVEPPASVAPLAPVEPPASVAPKKVPPPIKRAKAPVADTNQELSATPTQAESSLESDSESVPNHAIFQAVGVIVGDVYFDESAKGSITIDQKQYPLFYAASHKLSCHALKKEIERTGHHRQRLLVYPRVTHFPKREQHHLMSFQLVAFEGDGQSFQNGFGLLDFEFKLCGLWQFIPVCSIPCFSIFKNFNQQRLAYIKEAPVEQKVRFMKGSHIPVLWPDAPIRPFRFNPKLDKEQQGQASFVGIKAKFLPDRDVFGFSELCIQPTSTPPQFLKAGKKDKAQALQNRRQRAKENSGG